MSVCPAYQTLIAHAIFLTPSQYTTDLEALATRANTLEFVGVDSKERAFKIVDWMSRSFLPNLCDYWDETVLGAKANELRNLSELVNKSTGRAARLLISYMPDSLVYLVRNAEGGDMTTMMLFSRSMKRVLESETGDDVFDQVVESSFMVAKVLESIANNTSYQLWEPLIAFLNSQLPT
jgi:hypothetical protein